jgi:ubiquinone/menaquinone biosynthesis C-methylase UbiE
MAIRLIGGRTGRGRLAGVDLSPTMVAMTRRRNERLTRAGRLDVRQGNAMALPFADESFDAVTAVETLYFWPDPLLGLTECRRVLRPGGWLAVTLEMTRDAAEEPTLLQRLLGGKFTDRSEGEGLSIVSGLQLAGLLRDAGFSTVRFTVEPRRSLGWLCVLGRK